MLHPPSLPPAQFGQPRFNSGPERLPLNRSWSTNARGCSPRAPLPRQSMSGSPPAEEPSVTSGESKPPSYPSVSSPAVTTTGHGSSSTAPVSGSSQQQQQPPPPPVGDPLPAQVPPRYGKQSPSTYVESPGLTSGVPSYPISTLEPSVPGPATRSLTQKSTRRTKAHVASACVNCKKKHLGCDSARPCRRCVLAGKAVSIFFFF